jgi:transcriptional antiterminator NusG
MMDEAYHLIRTLPRVTGFLGSQGEAVPLKDSEVEALIDRVEAGGAREGVAVLHEVGDKVMVVDGPFEGFAGVVESSDPDNARLKVSVSIFGRATPVDLEHNQVQGVS